MCKAPEDMDSIKNSEQLLEILDAVDICVPKISPEIIHKMSDYEERYSICRLLSTLAYTEYLSYPLSLKKRESPDYLLCCNGQNIGIEVTQATSEVSKTYMNHATADIIAEPSFSHATEMMSKKQTEDLCEKNELDDGFVGSKIATDIKLFIEDAINKKLKKLNNDGFSKFEQNWLLVYENTPSGFFSRKEKLLSEINNLCPSDVSSCFNKIFIESMDSTTNKSFIAMLSCDGVECFPLKDI